MINAWRDLWGMGDFTFLFVQLAPSSATDVDFAAMRLQQSTALPGPGSLVDTSGMAVIADIGDSGTLHAHVRVLVPPTPSLRFAFHRACMPLYILCYCYCIMSAAASSGHMLPPCTSIACCTCCALCVS